MENKKPKQTKQEILEEVALLAELATKLNGFSKYIRNQFAELNYPERLFWLRDTVRGLREEGL